jgi:hypothetical protein
LVEVFNTPESLGDGVVDMMEEGERLVPYDPAEYARVLRQPPNVDPATASKR